MKRILICFLLLISTVGCQSAILDDQTIPSATTIPWISQTDQAETVEPVQSPAILP